LIWRRFRKSAPNTDDWWRRADALADAPARDAVDRLEHDINPHPSADDETERQIEMIAGLGDLAALATSAALPVIPTQHRVIGGDACHFIAPIGIGAETEGTGKLFLTATRLVVMGAAGRAVPWHRVRRVSRDARELVVVVAGDAEPLVLRCNTYGEALAAGYIMRTLLASTAAASPARD